MRRRSLLYVPAISEKMIRKSEELKPDAIIFDLEDAVLPDKKNEARETLQKSLRKIKTQGKEIIIRVNDINTEWFEKDIEIVSEEVDAILIPKVQKGEDIKMVERKLHDVKKNKGIKKEIFIMAMIERPLAILNIKEIVEATELLSALMFGPADLSKEMGCENSDETLLPLKIILIAGAKTKGLDVIDGPYFQIKDTEGLKNDCIRAKRYGFNGKQALHPVQIPVINQVFSPSKEEIERAKRIIEKFEKTVEEGKGVAVLNGEVIERLHYEMAIKTLRQAGDL